MSERNAIPVDEAVERLAVIPDYDPGDGPKPCVHTFRIGRMMLGAHWAVEQAREAMEKFGVYELDPAETMLNHSLLVTDDTGPIIFETAAIPAERSRQAEQSDNPKPVR